MNRRSFAIGAAGFGVSRLLVPKGSRAQGATPVSTPATVKLRDTTTLPSLRYIVYRGFDADSKYVFPEWLPWLYSFGMSFPTADDAIDSMEAFAKGIWKFDSINSRDYWDEGTLRPASIREMGDISAAWSYASTNRESGDIWTSAISVVVQDRWMQGLWSVSDDGNAVTVLADFAEHTLKRWPNTSKMIEKNGMHSGGLWDSMPTLSDMPEGASLAYESEEEGPFTPEP